MKMGLSDFFDVFHKIICQIRILGVTLHPLPSKNGQQRSLKH